MKISIITVCFNSEKTIEKAIKSVIHQDYMNKEHIIIDGGSKDGTIDIIKKWDRYITKWISEPDQGIFDAMNKGIRMATGDIIAFLNSDDWYMKGALSMVHEAFAIHNIDCVCCDNYVIEQDGSKVYYDASFYTIEDLYKKMIYYHSAIFAYKKWFKRYDNFDLKYNIAADYDWMLKIINRGAKLFYLHKPVFTFCYGGISSTNKIECAKEAREIAIEHLSNDRKEYLKDIDNIYCEVILSSSNKEWIYYRFKSNVKNNNPIILWGAGYQGIQCLKWLQKGEIEVSAFIDKNESKHGKMVEGVNVYPPQFLYNKICNIIITPDKYIREIQKEISSIQGEFLVYEFKNLLQTMAKI